jgi:hypothetical protein
MNGIVFVKARGVTPSEALEELIREAMLEVEDGRCLVVTWVELLRDGARVPVEPIAVRTVVGAPGSQQRRDGEWLFFGNGSARLFRDSQDRPYGTCFWLAFRKRGEKVFARRHSAPPGVTSESKIDVSNPVFTRDVANNVWHMVDTPKCDRILRRLQCLLSWSDEVAIVFSAEGRRRMRWCKRNFDDDLIGVPVKIPYRWGSRLFLENDNSVAAENRRT